MATKKQIKASRLNIKKALKKWLGFTPRQRALRQPEGRARKKPGTSGKGEYYHIVVRPKTEFTSFRVHDIGRKGHSQRVAGRRSSGSWATHKWLIAKSDATTKGKTLVATNPKTKKILSLLQGKITLVKGDIYKARPRYNVPEKDKPTPAMKRAQTRNIKKAQAARRK